MKIGKNILLVGVLVSGLFAQEVPNLQMPKNKLTFQEIAGYKNYRVVATHFRVDKNELRYILANKIAYNALIKHVKIMPEGSKVVKIGWSVKKMPTFSAALEADKIQRVEYMVKNSKKFNHNGDNWGYARFVKSEDGYKPWTKGTLGCIACHSSVKGDDYLFTQYQKRF